MAQVDQEFPEFPIIPIDFAWGHCRLHNESMFQLNTTGISFKADVQKKLIVCGCSENRECRTLNESNAHVFTRCMPRWKK